MTEIVRLLPDNSLAERRQWSGQLPTLNPAKGLGVWKWLVDNPPAYDPATHSRTQTGFTVDGDTVTLTYVIASLPRPIVIEPVAKASADAAVMREIEELRAQGKRLEALELLLKHKGYI